MPTPARRGFRTKQTRMAKRNGRAAAALHATIDSLYFRALVGRNFILYARIAFVSFARVPRRRMTVCCAERRPTRA